MLQPRSPSALEEDIRFLQRGTLMHGVGLVVGNISPLLAILLARTFPPEAFGLYVSLQLLVLTISKLSVLGMDRGLCWFFASHKDEPARCTIALSGATWLTSLVSVLIIGAIGLAWIFDAFAWLPGLQDVDAPFAFVCFIALLPWTLLHLYSGAFEGLKQPGYRIFLSQGLVMALAPASALVAYAVVPALGRWAMPLGLVLANTVGAAIVMRAARKRFPALRYVAGGAIDRHLLAYSVPIGASGFLSGIVLRIDLWMLVALLGPAPAAVYAVMTMLSNGVRTVRQSYDQLLVPIVGGMGGEGREHLAKVFSYSVHVVSSIQLPVALAVLVFPREILLIAGREYVLQPEALAVLLAASLVQGFLGLSAPVLAGLGRSRALLFVSVITLVLNVGLNAWLIPRYGISGAAIATTLAVTAGSLVLVIVQVRQTGYWLFQKHLWTNLLMIVAFMITVFSFQATVLEWSLWERAMVFLGGSGLVGINAWVRRQRSSSPVLP